MFGIESDALTGVGSLLPADRRKVSCVTLSHVVHGYVLVDSSREICHKGGGMKQEKEISQQSHVGGVELERFKI